MNRLALRFCARSPVICSIAFSEKKAMRYLSVFSVLICLNAQGYCCRCECPLYAYGCIIYSFSLDFQNIEEPFLSFEPYFLIFNTFSFNFSHSRALLLRIRREAKRLSIHSVMPTNQ